MKIVSHRVNTVAGLVATPTQYGVEIDIRGEGGNLVLTHDPVDPAKEYDDLDSYLAAYQHAFVIFNLKEAGYEQRVIELAAKYGIENYFLLDVEFPYLYRATRKEGVRKIAVRYSEAEPIEAVLAQVQGGQPLLDWVWIDTNTQLPLTAEIVEKLKPFKTALVCPDRWGRPQDIPDYIAQMKSLGFQPDLVMTSPACMSLYEAW
jgi:hypothetical protein